MLLIVLESISARHSSKLSNVAIGEIIGAAVLLIIIISLCTCLLIWYIRKHCKRRADPSRKLSASDHDSCVQMTSNPCYAPNINQMEDQHNYDYIEFQDAFKYDKKCMKSDMSNFSHNQLDPPHNSDLQSTGSFDYPADYLELIGTTSTKDDSKHITTTDDVISVDIHPNPSHNTAASESVNLECNASYDK